MRNLESQIHEAVSYVSLSSPISNYSRLTFCMVNETLERFHDFKFLQNTHHDITNEEH